MIKRPMTIVEMYNLNTSYSIVFNNIGLYPELLQKLHNIIKVFATGTEFFFGHYKIDGIHLSKEEMLRYSIEIPSYFDLHGEYHIIDKHIKNNTKTVRDNRDLIVCRTSNEDDIYNIIDKLFHYYLETTFFCPKISWETFVNLYKDYINKGTNDYVLKGYADFLFSYVDSGDFCITFDPEVYDHQVIREKIDEIFC